MPSAPTWIDISQSLGVYSIGDDERLSIRKILIRQGGIPSPWDAKGELLQKLALVLGASRVRCDTEGGLLRKILAQLGGIPLSDDNTWDLVRKIYDAFGGVPPTPPAAPSALLTEDFGYLLQENGSKILL